MKVIVCEICDYTEFTKEDGFFVCQGCGCKYSREEVKNLMRDSDDGNNPEDVVLNKEPEEDEDSEKDIPIHSFNSPNRLIAKVIKVGHETYTTASVTSLNVLFGGEPEPVFIDGPDQVGNIGAAVEVCNVAGKTIKYANVHLKAYNAVNDQVDCTVKGNSIGIIEITGPIAVGDRWEGYADGLWYNSSITYAVIDHIHVIYMDNTEEIYKGEEFLASSLAASVTATAAPYAQPVAPAYPAAPAAPVAPAYPAAPVAPVTPQMPAPPPAPAPMASTITIKRNQVALTTKTNKLNRLVCTLNSGQQFELGLGQTYTLPVNPGTYQISFDFWGKSLVPEKNKKTPFFQVNGNVYIELTVDQVMGGFKSQITQY